jgi:hypothetical protein
MNVHVKKTFEEKVREIIYPSMFCDVNDCYMTIPASYRPTPVKCICGGEKRRTELIQSILQAHEEEMERILGGGDAKTFTGLLVGSEVKKRIIKNLQSLYKDNKHEN